MMDKEFKEITITKNYYIEKPFFEDVYADFLRPNGNRLLISIPDISDIQEKAILHGTRRAGILSKNGAILLIWQFKLNGKTIITLDSPFDARKIPELEVYDEVKKNIRLYIDLILVDPYTNQTSIENTITMPPELTIEFLSEVKNQRKNSNYDKKQYQKWMSFQPEELAEQTHMWLLGKW